MTTVSAIFSNRTDAQAAFSQLEDAGIADTQISLVMTDTARGTHFGLRESSKVDEGAAAGAATGGLIGAVLGMVASAGVIAIPGLNLVVAGAIVTGLAGLGAGAFAGGLVGGLIGAGIPEHEARLYEKESASGNVLIAVKAEDSEQEKTVKRIFKAMDGRDIAA
jgi:hypothetical protein